MKQKLHKRYIYIFTGLIIAAIAVVAAVVANMYFVKSNSAVQKALDAGRVVYYTKARYWDESQAYLLDKGAFPKEYWEHDPEALCFGVVDEACYWVPNDLGLVETDIAKKIIIALSTAIPEPGVSVDVENGKYIVRITKVVPSGDLSAGEIEQVTKNIELYTHNYEIYYKGVKGWDKYYEETNLLGG
jgi:hypothetical protein